MNDNIDATGSGFIDNKLYKYEVFDMTSIFILYTDKYGVIFDEDNGTVFKKMLPYTDNLNIIDNQDKATFYYLFPKSEYSIASIHQILKDKVFDKETTTQTTTQTNRAEKLSDIVQNFKINDTKANSYQRLFACISKIIPINEHLDFHTHKLSQLNFHK